MNRLSTACFIAFALLIVCGCGGGLGDPQMYGTQLPNGLQHVSNGGEQGWIGKPFPDGKGSDLVYPRTHEWSCNEFAILGDDVIGVEIQYAYRAFVDPPVATRWFYLDTKNRTATTFDSLDALREHCKSLGYASLPAFVRNTSETKPLY